MDEETVHLNGAKEDSLTPHYQYGHLPPQAQQYENVPISHFVGNPKVIPTPWSNGQSMVPGTTHMVASTYANEHQDRESPSGKHVQEDNAEEIEEEPKPVSSINAGDGNLHRSARSAKRKILVDTNGQKYYVKRVKCGGKEVMKRQKVCQYEGCVKHAAKVGIKAFCVSHGGGRRCQHKPYCNKGAYPGGEQQYCVAHGGGRRCSVADCKKAARNGSDYCIAHGGLWRCRVKNCPNSREENSKLCSIHSDVPKCNSSACRDYVIPGKTTCDRHNTTLQNDRSGVFQSSNATASSTAA